MGSSIYYVRTEGEVKTPYVSDIRNKVIKYAREGVRYRQFVRTQYIDDP